VVSPTAPVGAAIWAKGVTVPEGETSTIVTSYEKGLHAGGGRDPFAQSVNTLDFREDARRRPAPGLLVGQQRLLAVGRSTTAIVALAMCTPTASRSRSRRERSSSPEDPQRSCLSSGVASGALRVLRAKRSVTSGLLTALGDLSPAFEALPVDTHRVTSASKTWVATGRTARNGGPAPDVRPLRLRPGYCLATTGPPVVASGL
jgi:hypothetical protein